MPFPIMSHRRIPTRECEREFPTVTVDAGQKLKVRIQSDRTYRPFRLKFNGAALDTLLVCEIRTGMTQHLACSSPAHFLHNRMLYLDTVQVNDIFQIELENPTNRDVECSIKFDVFELISL